MREDCLQVDELLRQLADYKNDVADTAAEKLLRKCSSSWEAYRYLQDRVHDPWLPDSARQQVRQIIKRIQVQLNQGREYGWAYEPFQMLVTWNSGQFVAHIVNRKNRTC